jgi:hypothetical protein
VRQAIDTLLERKIAGEELNEEPRVDVLNDFLSKKIDFYSEHIGEIDTIDRPQTEILDDLFRATLSEVWN